MLGTLPPPPLQKKKKKKKEKEKKNKKNKKTKQFLNVNVFLWHCLILMLTGSSPFLDPEMLKFIEDFQQLVLKDALQGGTDRRNKVINFQLPQELEVGSCSSQSSHAWSWYTGCYFSVGIQAKQIKKKRKETTKNNNSKSNLKAV